MTDPTYTLWLQTFLALSALGIGLMLHLKWHPLRESFSDAWDMLQSLGWLVPLMAALQWLSGTSTPWSLPSLMESGHALTSWHEMRQLWPKAAQEVALVTHSFFPPWPLALAVPGLLSLLMWRVKRFPYRYDSRKKRPAVQWSLMAAVLLSWCWLGMEGYALFKPMPEWLETIRELSRSLAQACMMAGVQVYMILLVMGWVNPEEPDAHKDLWLALELTLARWRGVMLLAGMEMMWLLAWHSISDQSSYLTMGVLVEASLLFAAVPMVVAWQRMPLASMLELTPRVFIRSFLALLGWFISATVLLTLVHLSLRGMQALGGESAFWAGLIRILIALVLATTRSWLFLTFVITLLRHGFKTNAPQERGN